MVRGVLVVKTSCMQDSVPVCQQINSLFPSGGSAEAISGILTVVATYNVADGDALDEIGRTILCMTGVDDVEWGYVIYPVSPVIPA